MIILFFRVIIILVFFGALMIRLFFPVIIALVLAVVLTVKTFALPAGVIDCDTSDVPGCVTLTFADGSQKVLPIIFPTFQNTDDPKITPCDGPVSAPILWRPDSKSAWLPVVQKTFCYCVAFDYATHKCKKYNGAC